MSTFRLPDLGEGLPDAEIVEWHVAEGDRVVVDQPLVSVETAKAVVEVPSPQSGRIARLCAQPGDIVATGAPLVEFESEATDARPDAGTVVGAVEASAGPLKETEEEGEPANRAARGVKALPAVRALARRLGVDLAIVTPTGPDGSVTRADVERAAKTLSESAPLEPLRGARRAMARNMALAQAEVAAVTVVDDADIDAWPQASDLTVRLVRAVVAGCRAEPALNAWYEHRTLGRRMLERIDLGIAADTDEGLFVPVLRDVAGRDPADLRAGLERMKEDVRARAIPPEEMRGYTFILSNFGTFAGRYASPMVLPPSVAILGAGRARRSVVAHGDAPAVRRLLPLSLTFDHRAVTGGEAGRFLAAVIADLEKSA